MDRTYATASQHHRWLPRVSGMDRLRTSAPTWSSRPPREWGWICLLLQRSCETVTLPGTMSGPEFQDLKPLAPGGFYSPFTHTGFSFGGLNQGQIFPVIASGSQPTIDCFREGETLLIYLEVGFPPKQTEGNPDATYISGLRIKPWWLRSAVEFRTPGDPSQSHGNPLGVMGGAIPLASNPAVSSGVTAPSQIDHDVFGGWAIFYPPFHTSVQFAAINTNLPAAGGGRGLGNRNVWYPSPKRLDTVPSIWGAAPLNVAVPPTTSDSVLFDDVW